MLAGEAPVVLAAARRRLLEASRLDQAERLVRQAEGLSRGRSTAIVAGGRSSTSPQGGQEGAGQGPAPGWRNTPTTSRCSVGRRRRRARPATRSMVKSATTTP